MLYDFDAAVNHFGTNSIKWERGDLAPDVLPLWVADMDFPCAQPIKDALTRRVAQGIFGYSTTGDAAYAQAICGWFKSQNDWDVPVSDLFYAPGVVSALSSLVRLLSKEGQGVLLQNPVYYPFARVVQGAGRNVVNNALALRDGRYEMDFEDLSTKAAQEDTVLMILCSPHNPVGRVWTPEELRRLVDICQRNAVTILADEIHCDLLRAGGTFTTLAKLCPEYKDKIITLRAPSKTFNLAGMQSSHVILHDPALQKMWTDYASRVTHASITALAITSTQAAYEHGGDWLRQVRAYIDGNVAYARDYLREHLPRATYFDAEATYLLWVDVGPYLRDGQDIERELIQQQRICVQEGSIFGEEGRGFLRINVACRRAHLQQALKRICTHLRGESS